jgi:hypothetical protein
MVWHHHPTTDEIHLIVDIWTDADVSSCYFFFFLFLLFNDEYIPNSSGSSNKNNSGLLVQIASDDLRHMITPGSAEFKNSTI